MTEHEILQRICVSRPYCSLDRIKAWEPGRLSAYIPAEMPRGSELGLLTAAEMGRGGAIAGSMALATLNQRPVKHYYLATDATLSNSPQADEWSGGMTSTSTARFLDRRQAVAESTMFDRFGRACSFLRVTYSVLSSALFERMFRSYARETPPAGNPYTSELPLEGRRWEWDALCARVEVRPELCAGHFDGFPAMPVAFLMSGLVSLSARFLGEHLGKEGCPYWVSSAEMKAANLAKAGDALSFRVRHADGRIHATATNQDGKPIGELWPDIKFMR